ncbi:hypothetical protein ACFOLD_11585 [Kocuria carniphila]
MSEYRAPAPAGRCAKKISAWPWWCLDGRCERGPSQARKSRKCWGGVP